MTLLTDRGLRSVFAAGGLLALMTVVAACGNSSSGSASGGSSQNTGASSANKDPIMVGWIGPVNTATISYAGIIAALKAGAAAANKTGGINGHPLKIWTCNTNYQAPQELTCAREAASAGLDVIVGDNNDFEAAPYASILAKAGIPEVENTGPLPNGFAGPLTFPATFPQSTLIACDSPELAKAAGGNKVVEVSNAPPALVKATSPIYAAAAKVTGDTFLPPIIAPSTASDFSSYVADAQKEGANIVLMVLLGAGPQAFVRASSQAGATYSICTPLGLSGVGGWSNLGSATNRLYVGADFEPLSSNLPLVHEFLSQMAAEVKSGDAAATTSPKSFMAQTMEAWLGLQIVEQAAAHVHGSVTKSALVQALRTTRFTFGGIIPPFSFSSAPENGATSPLPAMKAYTHIWNSTTYLWKWNPSAANYTLFTKLPDTFGLAIKGSS